MRTGGRPNYLSVRRIDLYDNPLLKDDMPGDHQLEMGAGGGLGCGSPTEADNI
jgi:hypothetical protein